MGLLKFTNNASTTLSGSINNSQTTLTVANASGFPSLAAGESFYATMYELSGQTEINIEIVKVTATSGNLWTVVRGQDGTTARSRDGVTNCYVQLRLTAAGANEMLQVSNNLSDLGSAATARTNLGLGTIATQAADNVAITGGSISGVSFETLDSTTTIADNADPTKKVAFEVSGVTTGTTRTMTIPNASGTIALTSNLSSYQPLDSDLTAVAGLSANGLIARTGTGTMAVRSITQPAAGVTVTNGDGVSGNPTLALANDLAAVEAINTTGFVKRTAADTWTAASIVNADVPSALTGKTYNGITPTANATGFSLAGGTTSKTLTVNNSITLAGTDGTTITLPAVTGTVALTDQTFNIGTTPIAINRASGALSLTGVSIDGSAGSATTATTATTATNIASGVLGSLPYQSAAGSTALLAPNTTANKRFLRQTGTGSVGAAPAWDSVTSSDVGLGNVENTALSTWAGSTNLTTLGTVATGTWNATTIGLSKGGTGQTTATAAFNALSPSTTLGDLIYHNGTDDVRLAGNTTTSRRFLRQTGTGSVSAAPAWDGLQDGDIPATLTGKTYNGLTLTAAATGFTVAGGTTSKTLTVSNSLTLAGTDASTLNIGSGGTLGSAAFTASTAYAPAAGSSSITTVGTIGSGTWQGSAIGVSYGGTGATSKAAGFNALSPVTTLGDLIYGNGANSNTRLAGNTTTSKRFLTQTGTGTVSAAPGWNAIVDGDLPSALTGKTYNALTLTANATGFSVAGGTTAKTLQVNNNVTLAGTDGSTLNISTGGTLGSAAFTASTAYQAADGDLTAIAALAGTSGFLKKTAANTWALDTSTFITGNQTITVSGDATGSGTTSIALTLANTGVAASTYTSVTVDAKGRVTGGTNPSTLSGYGILDAQPLDADLTAIAGLAGTSGFLKKTAANTWSLDTSTYLTGNQTVTLSGDATGSGATSIAVTLANSGVAAGTYNNVSTQVRPFTVDAKGRVTAIGTAVTIAPAFSSVTGKPTTLSGYGITDALSNSTTSTQNGYFGNVYLYDDSTPSHYLGITNSANLTAARTLSLNVNDADRTVSLSGNLTVSAAATVSGTNTGDQTITLTGDVTGTGTGSFATTLANSGVTAGTYKSVTVDAKGRVTGGTNPTTLAGYGITDAQALDADLTAIAGLAGTSGFLKKTAANTWSLDTSTYLTGNQSITVSGDASGSGTTSIALTLATVTAAKGGTGQTSYAVGDLLYASASTTLSKLSGVATGNALISGGVATAPSWGKIGLTTHVSGTLGVGNGGTGVITLTGLVKGNGTSAFSAAVAGTDYVIPSALSSYAPLASPTFTGTVTAPNLTFNTAGGRIKGDFGSGTLANRVAFQNSTTNGTTALSAIPNGTGNASYYVAFNSSAPDNSSFGWLSATSTAVQVYSGKAGTGSYLPIQVLTSDVNRATFGASGGLDLATGLREAKVAMGADDIDVRSGNYFTKTISATTTFTVSNVPASGTAASVILELTNGGSQTVNWWTGMTWAGGTAPTLTTSGVDVLGFYTHDGGTTWRGLVLAKDIKAA